MRTRYGVDDEICTGDHSCIRLSGCPSLTVKPNPDPLRTDPVATVIDSCVGCGLCGEVAHAAVLCPSFYRAERVQNPTLWDRVVAAWRCRVIAMLGGYPVVQTRPAIPSAKPLAGPPPGAVRIRGAIAQLDRANPVIPAHPVAGPPGRARAMTRHSRLENLPGRHTGAEPRMGARPIKILIAALGGEGGGVLTDWIVAAATSLGLPVQSTSIPGVAQRTGATTYYIEIFPTPHRELGGRQPVLALAPGIGDVDLVVASELLEAGRTVAGGFVTPDRTLLIASTHRSHAIAERIAMGDGRFDTAKLDRRGGGQRARLCGVRHGRRRPARRAP